MEFLIEALEYLSGKMENLVSDIIYEQFERVLSFSEKDGVTLNTANSGSDKTVAKICCDTLNMNIYLYIQTKLKMFKESEDWGIIAVKYDRRSNSQKNYN